jgi:hypothetical protein
MSLQKGLRTRRGGGRVVWGGDACVALAGGGKRAQGQDEGDSAPKKPTRVKREGEAIDQDIIWCELARQ